MKKFKEFLIFLVGYCIISVINFCYTYNPFERGFNIKKIFEYYSDADFYIYLSMYIFFIPFSMTIITSILFALNITLREKEITRKKYYILLCLETFIVSFILSCIISCWLLELDLVLCVIYTIQVFITVVFMLWIFECIIEKLKS